jgi:hypothetical protein
MKWVVLVWNERLTRGDGFLEAYEELLHWFGTDYVAVDHRNVRREDIEVFFGGAAKERVYGNRQEFDLEGLKGRLMSSSYVPREEDRRFGAMMKELKEVFEKYQRGGKVEFVYETKVYVGRVT